MGFPLDYGLYIMFGKKGAGKSCTLARLAREGFKKGLTVYSNVPIKGTYYFNASDFGLFEFLPNSLVLIDEANLVWDNRDFKKFPKYTQDLFRYQRHFKITVYLFSQTYDVDKKLRDLADGLFIVNRTFKHISIVKTIDKNFVVTEASDYGGSDIQFGLSIRPFLLPGSRYFVFLPVYWKSFCSFETYELADYSKHCKYIEV